jgi:lipoprotein-anchoring transpeptidase ErfK/SrfK
MNRRILIIISLILTITVILIFLGIKKGKFSLPIRKSGITSISNLLTQAKESESKGELLSAKGLYQRLISEFANSAEVMNWQKKIESINIKLLFSPNVTPKSTLYEIKPADTLTKIAKEFNTTTDLIMKSNNLSSDRILPGRKIKVLTVPFSILIDKSQNLLILKSEEEIVKTYIVSTGENNSTPVGSFKITTKLINPTWFKAGAVVPPGSPENILGSRWLGFNLPGYGIHGTTEPSTIGKQVTQGCVRMLNSEIEELYTLVPIGTEVTIVD